MRCPDDSGEPTPEYKQLRSIGYAAISFWPAGVPVFFFLLLRRARKAIVMHRPSPLSRATNFLWSEYEDTF